MADSPQTYTPHPLHSRPRCGDKDLGAPIPESLHAVSVCLPKWADVIGYEEKEPRVIGQMRTGYPRFFFHPLINELRVKLDPKPGHEVLPFAGEAAARECALIAGGEASAVDGLWVAYFPSEALPQARAYWQHAGRILSSRAAEDWLAGRLLTANDTELQRQLRQRLAQWSGAPEEMVSLHPSGMAAIFAAFRAVTTRRPGRRTIMFGFPYTDTLKILQKFGYGVEFFPRGDADELAQLTALLAHEEVAGIFCEFPSNPLLQVPDLPAIRSAATAAGVPVIVDDTIGTSFNVEVLAQADLVATSLTKAFSGEGDVMAGALTINPQGIFGPTPGAVQSDGIYPRDLIVLENNSRDFPQRMEQTNTTAAALAGFLESHPAIERVFYPGLKPSPVYDALRKQGGGYGAVLSFLPRDPAENSPRIYERLRINHGISLGTTYSLVCPYVQLAHYHELSWAHACGIDPHLLRVAVGTEPWPDLRDRFSAALVP